jgi:glutaredoxin
MVDVVLYTRPGCPYCTLAKQLIEKKAVKFKEINIWQDARFKNAMVKRSGGASTVP